MRRIAIGIVLGAALALSSCMGEEHRQVWECWWNLDFTPGQALDLKVDRVDGSHLYLAASNGLYTAPNAFAPTWSQVSPTFFREIEPSFTTAGLVHAAVDGDVWQSMDYGDTWTSIGGGIPNVATRGARIAVDPTIGAHVYALVDVDLFETQGGAIWTALHTFPERPSLLASDPNSGQRLFAALPAAGLERSDDAGQTWTAAGLAATVTALAFDPTAPGAAYARVLTGVTNDAVFRSTDGGQSWASLGDPLPAGSIGLEVIGPFLVTSADADDLYRMPISGGGWEIRYGVAGGAYALLAPDWRHPGVAFAVEERLRKTVDSATTFFDADTGLIIGVQQCGWVDQVRDGWWGGWRDE
jgi:photosystem II stability/assembly factor-like uncharacterized protein